MKGLYLSYMKKSEKSGLLEIISVWLGQSNISSQIQNHTWQFLQKYKICLFKLKRKEFQQITASARSPLITLTLWHISSQRRFRKFHLFFMKMWGLSIASLSSTTQSSYTLAWSFSTLSFMNLSQGWLLLEGQRMTMRMRFQNNEKEKLVSALMAGNFLGVIISFRGY